MTARVAWERLTSVRTLLIVIACLALVAVVQPVIGRRLDDRRAEQQRVALLEINQQNRATLDRLRDCTTPEGRCYRDSQRRTAAVVAQLNAYNRLATACAATLPQPQGTTAEEALRSIDACIAARRSKPPG